MRSLPIPLFRAPRKSVLFLAGTLLGIGGVSVLWKYPEIHPETLKNRARMVQTNIRLDQDWSKESRLRLLNELFQLSISNSETEKPARGNLLQSDSLA